MIGDDELKPMLFLGNGSCSYGTGYEKDGRILFKTLGTMFGKPIPVLRPSNEQRYNFIEVKMYDPLTGDYTDETLTIYFTDLKNFTGFSFNETIPAELSLQLVTKETKIKILENEILEYQKICNVTSISDLKHKFLSDEVENARKLTNSFGGGLPGNPNAK